MFCMYIWETHYSLKIKKKKLLFILHLFIFEYFFFNFKYLEFCPFKKLKLKFYTIGQSYGL